MIDTIEVNMQYANSVFDVLRKKYSAEINYNDRDIKTLSLPLKTTTEWLNQIPKNTKLFFDVYESEPLVQFLGFKISYPDRYYPRRDDVLNVFEKVYELERNKANFLLLQNYLLDEKFEKEAMIDPTYIKEIDLIYPIACRNFY